MILLDTDHVFVLQWDGEAAERLRRRMADSTDEWLGITSITLEEQTRAAISRLGQSIVKRFRGSDLKTGFHNKISISSYPPLP